MKSEPDDASSPSPEPTGDFEGADMGDIKDQPTSSDGSPPQPGSSKPKPASNAKDPLRPRRKKARRACENCQRAHLTCGDERPCQRCVKRHLGDQCRDGFHKKAKYLHDTPNEALALGVGGRFPPLNTSRSAIAGNGTMPDSADAMDQVSGFYSQSPQAGFGIYPPGSMPPPMPDHSPMGSFSSQQSPVSPHFNANSSQQLSPMQSIPGSLPQPSSSSMAPMQQFSGALFEPSDPALFNFDLASLNFGNHYGALEFGMLNHMSSGAAGTPPGDGGQTNPMNPTQAFKPAMSSPTGLQHDQGIQGFAFTQDTMMSDGWKAQSGPGSGGQIPHQHQLTANMVGNMRQDGSFRSPAYAIGSGPSRMTSASPRPGHHEMVGGGYENPPASPAMFVGASPQQPVYVRQQPQPAPPSMAGSSVQQFFPRKRQRDTSAIYDSVKEPYGYTEHFHMLTTFLERRFPQPKRLRIAKALASIRPSFISCTKSLNTHDLIFMEKCFQRTLMEYEDFIAMQGVPTIICRRTGEVAAASKEFSHVTGWRKDVLLGKEPNLNVNTGTSGAAGGDGDGSDAAAAGDARSRPPAIKREPSVGSNGANGTTTPARSHPVFLAELLDEDSVVRFYEDFAKLAFGDSRGSVMAPGRLLKYRTRDWRPEAAATMTTTTRRSRRQQQQPQPPDDGSGGGEGGPDGATFGGEASITKLGEKTGMIDCSFCWTVKRDVFEVPMLIVMNFLPHT